MFAVSLVMAESNALCKVASVIRLDDVGLSASSSKTSLLLTEKYFNVFCYQFDLFLPKL